jgi:starch synthase
VKILFAASEAVPFCKTGGLADMVSALLSSLTAARQDARLVLPKYRAIDADRFGLKDMGLRLKIPIGDSLETVSLWEGRLDKRVPVYFLDCPKYFDRDGLYGDAEGDYPDNDERFVLFSRAVFETAKAVDFRPDVIHCHDWQTGLIPAYLETLYSTDAFFIPTSTVFTIHNIAYQGVFSKDALFTAGFSWADFTPDKLEFFDQINFLKAGLIYASVLNTVSPTYSREIQTGPQFGRGMEGILKVRSRDLFGVLNGIDLKLWDPAKDKFLPKKFSAARLDPRADCKKALQRACGLKESRDTPVIGVVSRLDPQKGLDLVLAVVEKFLTDGAQLVVLGQGDKDLQASFSALMKSYPGQAYYCPEFNEPLAHQIYGGSDIFLMPSRFEPCGLSQMIAMHYGAVPVVTPTGGLMDTVPSYSQAPKKGLGFVATDVSAPALSAALEEALSLYRHQPVAWKALMKRGMSRISAGGIPSRNTSMCTAFHWREKLKR